MYHFRVFVLLFIAFCELCITNANAAITTSSKRNGSVTLVTSRRTHKNSTIFITTRSDFDGEVTRRTCQCVPFYTCDSEQFLSESNAPKACPDTDVCCNIETPLDLEPNTGTDTNTDTGGTNSPPSCQCVARSECQISLGEGIIDPKVSTSECPNTDDVCCPNEKMTSSLKPVTPTLLQCGERRNVLGVRVTGSEEATFTIFGEFPWMVSVWKTVSNSDEKFICGASILSSNIVLTAAHCVYQKDITALKVRAGDYDIKAQTPEEPADAQERSISNVIIHPNYNPQALLNDLAIIVTAEPFTYEQHVYPICTSVFSSEFANPQAYNLSRCLATGWGKSSANDNEKLSAILKKVDLKIIPSDECQNKLRETRLGKFFSLDKSFLCAEGLHGFDTCAGDGGGPLFCPLLTNRYQYVQVGITSWGIGCGDNIPGVYASVEANNAWLTSESEKYKISPATRKAL